MSNKKELKTVITLNKAIQLKKDFTEELKELGKDFRKSASKSLFVLLQMKEENLKRVTIALLKANSELGNNERIKERDIILRTREVVAGTLFNMKKKDSVIGKVKRFLKVGKPRYDEKALEQMIIDYDHSIADLNKVLDSFNEQTKIELTLLTT